SGSMGLTSSDMELQKMLIDERMRCENHKTNYQTLKVEHTRLQDEYTRAQSELKRLLSDRQVAQEKQQLLLAELRGELLDKTRELEELRLQVLSPQRLELLKAQVQQELEAPVRERFNKLQEEAENYRSEYNKLRYDLTFLKSEFDHQKEEHVRVLEERRIRHEADVARLERDKENLAAQLQSGDPARDGKRVEALLREKAQLHQRLKGLEAEVTELRAERNNSGAQAENVQRIQIRQLAESQAAVKALEAEKQSIHMQLDRTESELRLSQEQNTLLTGKLHKAEREIHSLNSQIEEMKHTHKLELSNLKLECVRAKGDLERDRDTLQCQVEDIEVMKSALERNKELISEKEREMVRRVQAAREDEIHKMASLQEEKLELENRLSELEQQRALQEAAGSSQKEEWDERLRAAQLGEESVRKELQNLRQTSKHWKISEIIVNIEMEVMRFHVTQIICFVNCVYQQNAELNLQIGTLSHSESELLDTNSRLRESLERVREELRSTRTQIERTQQEAERLVEERRVEWLEEKHKLQEGEAELREKYSQAKERLQRAAFAQKKRKTMTELKENKLQDKIQLLEAKIEELEIEASTARKKSSYSEEHAQLSKRLKELQRRHNEFRRLLLGNQMTSSTPLAQSLLIPAESIFSNIQEDQHQRELSVLRRRLEELENSQQQQLEELAAPLDRDRERLSSPRDVLPDLS
uniref:Centrosomal protein of 83 kDa n=1 Tax=Cyprinus carpio TaxID=7962 RepID=A0A8C1KYD7_CYPCA